MKTITCTTGKPECDETVASIAPCDALPRIEGVTENDRITLENAGYWTVQHVAMAGIEEIAVACDLPEARARHVINAACKVLGLPWT